MALERRNREQAVVPTLVADVHYRCTLRLDRRRFKNRIMIPPAASQIPACSIVFVSIFVLSPFFLSNLFHHGEQILENL